ncbi:MAG TPA: hypothetical protein DCG75_12110 [Bacteroidales bacterium]|jgi:hypothetical protein|nr:hypothetical protein [Bacteroidales bacterium]
MNKKLVQIITLLVFICSPFLLIAQNADEIIAKHIAAHGGAEKWDKLESVKINGQFTGFSEVKDFFSVKTSSGSYYSEYYLGQHKLIEGFDGKEGWTIDPWQEILFPRKINLAEKNVLMQKAEFFTPFYKYNERGNKVEYVGKENIDGIDAFVLKLTRVNGKTETWYLNSETYLEYKCESDWIDFARGLPSESYFDDFRTIDGLVIPFYIERTFWQRNRVTVIENIELNPEINKSIFEFPKSKEIEKLEFMSGEWDVKVDVWSGRRGDWFNVGSTSSKIDFEAVNRLRENISYEVTFPMTKILNYTYSLSTGRYKLAVFNDLYSEIDIFEGDFNNGELILDNTNVNFGSTAKEDSQKTQYTISKADDGSFSIVEKVSTDDGKSWNPAEKFTYTQKIK